MLPRTLEKKVVPSSALQLQRWFPLPLCASPAFLSLAPPSIQHNAPFSSRGACTFPLTQAAAEEAAARKYHDKPRGRLVEAPPLMQKSSERESDARKYRKLLKRLARMGHLTSHAITPVLEAMERAGVRSDLMTYTKLLKRCRKERALEVCQRLHIHLVHPSPSQHMLSASLSASLISTYGGCGRLDLARSTFEMEERDVGAWTAMIQAYTQCGRGKEALQLFQQMQQAGVVPNTVTFTAVLKACAMMKTLEVGKQVHIQLLHRGFLPNVAISNALISMYGKCGKIEDARAVFQEMKERNVVTWNSMIAEETEHGCGKEALSLFQQMLQASVAPDVVTFTTVLKACSITADLAVGKQVHDLLLRHDLPLDVALSTALVKMYGKCGKLEDACEAFLGMRQRNAISWNEMLAIFGENGQAKNALATFHAMQQQGVPPTAITFVHVLNACSQAGLVEEATACFTAMVEKHGIQPTVEHYALMVELLSGAGMLAEAETLINIMDVPLNAVILKTLHAACRKAKDAERAKRVWKRIRELEAQSQVSTVPRLLEAGGRKDGGK
ncbi:Pentatricopeptide repeat-containing protein [Balamuthia mandrillaris]